LGKLIVFSSDVYIATVVQHRDSGRPQYFNGSDTGFIPNVEYLQKTRSLIVKKNILTHDQGPNDDDANEQQDLAHHMYNLTLDRKLHLAPIESPQNILDLGTGTGIWASMSSPLLYQGKLR
jgi:hypothetical protein